MRVVMNQEFLIQSSYTLEASLSGYKGFHFSIHDLQRMGKDFCLSLLKLHQHLTMQVKCNIDSQLYNNNSYSENNNNTSCSCSCSCDNDLKKKSNNLKYVQISFCSSCSPYGNNNSQSATGTTSATEDYYSAGSESNPSEDNMSESEAIQLLAHSRHLLKKKKKKKSNKKSQSTEKKTAKKKKTKTKKVACPIKVVEIGNSNSPLSNHSKYKIQTATNINRRESKTQKPQEKRSLSSVTFPLSYQVDE